MRCRRLTSVPYGDRAMQLVQMAQSVMLNAYAPYSKFRVGAALITTSLEVTFAGCNVECADYDGTHAEEAALARMVGSGQRSPLMIAIVGGLEDGGSFLVPPCGKCRQKLKEFASLSGHDLDIVFRPGPPQDLLLHPPTKEDLRLVRLSQLLPGSFGPADIGVDLKKYKW